MNVGGHNKCKRIIENLHCTKGLVGLEISRKALGIQELDNLADRKWTIHCLCTIPYYSKFERMNVVNIRDTTFYK